MLATPVGRAAQLVKEFRRLDSPDEYKVHIKALDWDGLMSTNEHEAKEVAVMFEFVEKCNENDIMVCSNARHLDIQFRYPLYQKKSQNFAPVFWSLFVRVVFPVLVSS